MGRVILHIDVLEILSLAWDHPLVTGCLALMFTPPMFPVLVFFFPLLISTALCAVALVSVGHLQIDPTGEKEIAGWNPRVVDGDLSERLANARTSRNRVAEEESWLDLGEGFRQGSAWNKYSESTLLEDIREAGLKVDSRADGGGIEFMEEDLSINRQIEAFREYERSFSVKRDRERAAAATAAATTASALPGVAPSSMEMSLFPTQGNNDNQRVSQSQIPPNFLYNLRTGGMGTAAAKCSDGVSSRALPSGGEHVATAAASGARNDAAVEELLPFGSFHMSGIIDAVERARDEQHDPHQQPRSMFERGTAAAETQVSPIAEQIHLNNVEEKIVSPQSPIKRDHSLEVEFPGFTTTVLGGNDSPRSLLPKIPVMTSNAKLPAKKPSEPSLGTLSYNASLRIGNAVIYNASSESSRAGAALERHGSGASRNKHSTSRDRRTSSTAGRNLTRERSSKHVGQLDRTSDDWNQRKFSSHSDR